MFNYDGMAEKFFRSLAMASRVKAVYGTPDRWSRIWDCSWFVAEAVRALVRRPTLFTGTDAADAVTGLLTAHCAKSPRLADVLPLYFLYDKDDTKYTQKTVHMGIAMPNVEFLTCSKAFGKDGTILRDLFTLDMFEETPPREPRVHTCADWFKATPLTDVRFIEFPGNVAPTIPDGKRYAVAPAFMDLEALVKSYSN